MYEHVAKRLRKELFCVVTYDHRGYGRSGGKRGQLKDLTEWVNDMNAIIRNVVLKYNEKIRAPIQMFVWGHSSGGTGSVLYDQTIGKFDGLILTSPYLKVAKATSRFQSHMV
jgi:acylglycerol lipase